MKLKVWEGLGASPNARKLLVVGLIDAAGNGAFVSTSVVLFVSILHLTPNQVGQGLALGGLAGLVFLVPVGALADRLGVRRVILGLMVWRAAGAAAYVFVDGFVGYLLVVAFLGIAERASPPVLLSFVSSSIEESDRVKTAAAVQSVRNAGFTMGALLGSFALLSSGRTALYVIVLGNSISFVIAYYLLSRIQLVAEPAPVRPAGGRNAEKIRRRPAFVALTALSGVLNIHPTLLEVALPLWIVTHAVAPKSTVSVLFAINTVMVVLLQVRLAKGTESAASSARVLRRSGWMMLAFTILIAISATHLPAAPWGAIAILVGATVVLTFGEMWQAIGAWGASLALSPPTARGRFLAVFNLGPSIRSIVAPLIVTAWVVSAGSAGWIVLGVVLLLTGLITPSVMRWAERELARHEQTDADRAAAVPAS